MSHRHRLISKTESIRIWSIELGKAVSTLRIVLLKDPQQHWKLQSVIRIADPYHMKKTFVYSNGLGLLTTDLKVIFHW